MGSKQQSICVLFVHGDIVEVLCNCSTKSLVITQGVFVECLISSIRKSDIFYSFHISEHLQSFSPNLVSFWLKLRLFFRVYSFKSEGINYTVFLYFYRLLI